MGLGDLRIHLKLVAALADDMCISPGEQKGLEDALAKTEDVSDAMQTVTKDFIKRASTKTTLDALMPPAKRRAMDKVSEEQIVAGSVLVDLIKADGELSPTDLKQLARLGRLGRRTPLTGEVLSAMRLRHADGSLPVPQDVAPDLNAAHSRGVKTEGPWYVAETTYEGGKLEFERVYYPNGDVEHFYSFASNRLLSITDSATGGRRYRFTGKEGQWEQQFTTGPDGTTKKTRDYKAGWVDQDTLLGTYMTIVENVEVRWPNGQLRATGQCVSLDSDDLGTEYTDLDIGAGFGDYAPRRGTWTFFDENGVIIETKTYE